MPRQHPVRWHFCPIHTIDGQLPEEDDLAIWPGLLEEFVENKASYLCGQWETGAKTGRVHFQALLRTKEKIRPSSLRLEPCFSDEYCGFLSSGHKFLVCRDIPAARDYCMKDDGRVSKVYEYGVYEEQTKQGSRTDLSGAIAALRSGGLEALIEHHPADFVKYSTGMMRLSMLISKGSPIAPADHVLLYGPPGCGKSFCGLTLSLAGGDVSIPVWDSPLDEQNGWFDDLPSRRPYRALFDDFDGRRSGVSLRRFLRLSNGYRIRCPVKGGYVYYQPTEVVYTSNYHPREWWKWDDRIPQWLALVRRFTAVIEWHSDDYNDYTVHYAGTPGFNRFFGSSPTEHYVGDGTDQPRIDAALSRMVYRIRYPLPGGALASRPGAPVEPQPLIPPQSIPPVMVENINQ